MIHDDQDSAQWQIVFNEFIPEEEPLRETLFSLGNGYFVTRGAAEECRNDDVHYPGTYLAGGYNRLKSEAAGRTIENEDLVNWPNWLYLTFSLQDEEWFDLDAVDILSYEHRLDVRRGVTRRSLRFRDSEKRITRLISTRFVHMGNKHLAGISWTLVPENWSGSMRVRSGLDGTVVNSGVQRYLGLNGRHLEFMDWGREGEDGMYISVRTRQSHLRMTQAARLQLFTEDGPLPAERRFFNDGGFAAQDITFNCEENREIRIEKIAALYTSRDHAVSEERGRACQAVSRAERFDALLVSHERTWGWIWHRCNIVLANKNVESQKILRLHIFHLLQTASLNSVDWDMGIPSRGWHGEAYRGHIFWDELFIFPFLNFRIPELTRELLLYRYRRLDEARHAAAKAGFAGAMFPWQSGSDGREETQVLHLNPQSGEWEPDNTHLQRHVNAAIAYNVCQYFDATLDIEFLSFYGMEMLLSISRFLASLTHYDEDRKRYEIHNVVGPDEFHTACPGSGEPGLNNNAYTNVMTAWVLKNTLAKLALPAQDRKEELLSKLEIDDEELLRWKDICEHMFVPFHDTHIISQFEGYEDLDEFDWDSYQKKYGNIERLDRILHAEGDSPNRYKAGKQADVLMLFYLFSAEELQDLFDQMGYDYDVAAVIPENIAYYVKRSSFGSSLSRLVYSWVLARSDREASWKYFLKALDVDFKDIQNGTTREGIHLGAMAGTVDMVQRCYTGLEIRDDVLWINPALPDELTCIEMRIRYRGHWINMIYKTDSVRVRFEKGWSPEVRIGFEDQVYTVGQGESRLFAL